MGVGGTNPPPVKSPSATVRQFSIATQSSLDQKVLLYVFVGKNSHKWTHAVQTFVVQGSIYKYMHACMCVNIYTYIYTHMYIHTHIFKHTDTLPGT